ncbi:ATP-dependent RNA helicase SUV3, mitochondrial [Rhodotorula toruloides]|uniref:RNA helicase n=2 Tax=Rhodotorula toruloides TaxID=5286 RepID=A0A0K3C944_RHOTO|nr:ATP-dependent RNA helicase SUV3, mitochondrial [Rhodotorula toruloides]
MLRHLAQPLVHCTPPPPSFAARSLHSSAPLWRGQAPTRRKRVSLDLINTLKSSGPQSSRQAALARLAQRAGNSRPSYGAGGAGRGGRGGYDNRKSSGPSTISRATLCHKLRQHLVEVWQGAPGSGGRPRRISPQIRSLASDLGVNEDELSRLTTKFSLQAAEAVPDEAWQERTKGESVPPAHTSFDMDEVAKTYIEEGPEEALWNASLAAFLAWVRTNVAVPPVQPNSSQSISTVTKLHLLASIADRRFAYEQYFSARQRRRKLILHVGPTNSGKTYNALVALARARTGAYAGPLRLLAHEVFTRFNEGKIGQEGKRVCNLVTGEEKRIVDPEAGLQSCTVEMFPLQKRLEVGVIDEIQMIGDPQRGAAWTAAVIGSTCDELHLCGEESVVELIQTIAAELGDECIVKRYQRLSPLVVAEKSLEGDLSKIRRGDCLVTFSRSNIFAFKRAVEQRTGLKVAVAYGGLPPEVREEQARAFNAGEFDVLVASDAVGMGLNLKIRRIVFESVHKFDGKNEIRLPTPQVKQIAGRAGRYGVHTPVSPSAPDFDPVEAGEAEDGKKAEQESTLGEVTTLDASDLPILREAMKEPIVQVRQASITAPPEAYKELYSILPASTPLSRVVSLSRAMTRTMPHYRSTGTGGIAFNTDTIAHIRPLTFEERYTFGLAPVNKRDAYVVESLMDFASSYAAGEPVFVDDWADKSGLFGLLERVDEAHAMRAELLADENAPKPTGDVKRSLISVFSPVTLSSLESNHRCLTLYLWLSYRLAPIFCDQKGARELRKRVEKAIETTLDGIKFERSDRSSGAKHKRAVASGMRV